MTDHAVDDEILSEIATEFGLGRILTPAAYVDGGVSGEVFKVTAADGDWAVKRLYHEPDLEQLEVEVGLKNAARAAGIVSPLPVRTGNGNLVATAGERHWLASVWVDVSRDRELLVEPGRLAQVGEIVATLHNLRLPAPTDVTPWLTTPPTDWEQLRSLARASAAPWAATFEELYPELVRLAEFSASAAPGAVVLSHCDLGPANFGAADDNLVVFDWERAGATLPAQELGYVLTQWSELGDPAVVIPPIVAGYRARSVAPLVVGADMFVYTANAYLNFLESSIRAGNERRTGRILDKPITVDLLRSIADIANG